MIGVRFKLNRYKTNTIIEEGQRIIEDHCTPFIMGGCGWVINIKLSYWVELNNELADDIILSLIQTYIDF